LRASVSAFEIAAAISMGDDFIGGGFRASIPAFEIAAAISMATISSVTICAA
jgi:hypothetical protein